MLSDNIQIVMRFTFSAASQEFFAFHDFPLAKCVAKKRLVLVSTGFKTAGA